MSARPFLAPLAVFAVGLVALNMAIEPASAGSLPRALFDAIDRAAGVTDVFVGSSLVAQAVVPAAWDAARPGGRALNVGFNATFAVEHDILLRRTRRLGAGRVYYGFSDLDLSTPASETNGKLTGNAAVFDALDPDTAIRFRAGGVLDRWRIRLNGRVPVFKNRFSAWSRVEHLRRQLATIGWPHPAAAPEFEPLDEVAFASRADAIVHSAALFSDPVLDLLQVATDMHAETIVIQMPATARHRQRFFSTPAWRDYRAAISSRLAAMHITFIDASDWSSDSDFHDAIHLGPDGAVKFTARLAAQIKAK